MNHEQASRLFESFHCGIVHHDPSGRVLGANAAAEKILEMEAARMKGRLAFDEGWEVVSEEGSKSPGNEHPTLVALRTGKIQRAELTKIAGRPKDAVRYVDVTAIPFENSGRIGGAYTVLEDVTDRRKAQRSHEEALERELNMNDSLARVARALMVADTTIADLSVIVLEEARRLTTSRHGFVSDIDRASGKAVGHSLTKMERECRERTLSVPAVVGSELLGQIVLADPSRDYTERDLVTVGRLADLYGLAILHLRRSEELAKAKVQAEEASAAKSRFLSTVSHELRTPLNAMLGMAEALAKTRLDDEQLSYLEIFKTAGDDLLALISDILDITKIEAGQLELECVPFDLPDVVEKTVCLLGTRAAEKGLELIVRIDPRTPRRVMGDPLRLRQILMNLTNNAIKFTEAGHVEVRVEPAGEASLRFAVEDTGIGISEEKQPLIFEHFTQVDSSVTRRHGGSGLGLAISRRLVQVMGGDIALSSRLGRGSRFTFEVVFDALEESPPLKGTEPQLSGLSVLTVIPSPPARFALVEFLSDQGAEVLSCASLTQMGRLLGAGEPMSALVLDGQLLDGDEVEEVVENAVRVAKSRPVVCLVDPTMGLSKSMGPSRDRTVFCVSKPVRRMELLQAVLRAAGRPGATPLSSTSPPEPPSAVFRDRKILLIEDSYFNQRVVEAFFRGTGARVDVASDGQAGIERFCEQPYDLVLMDVQMPGMDGWTTTMELRKIESERSSSRTPVIAMTAHALPSDVQMAQKCGCDAHLSKPIRRRSFLRLVAETLGFDGRAGFSGVRESDESDEEEDAEGGVHVRLDPALRDLFGEFLEDLRGRVVRIEALLEKRRFEEIAVIGHSTKGEGGTYGLDKVTQIGARIQAGARERNAADVATWTTALLQYLKKIRLAD